MATELKLRRGTTSQHQTFTGASSEVTVDSDKETVVVHDGSTAGGFPLAREDGSNVTDFSVSGGIFLGGTGNANKLDDYEEGVFTPQFLNVATPTYVDREGYYTKIGNVVHVYGFIEVSGLDNNDASAIAISVPFASSRDYIFGGAFGHKKNGSELFTTGSMGGFGFTNNGSQLKPIDSSSASVIPFFEYTSCKTSGELSFAVTYETTS